MSKQLFGTDGIRGVPGEFPLDDATLVRVGAALGHYLRRVIAVSDSRNRVLIGRDTRESGPHIEECIARGLAAAGTQAFSERSADHAGRGVGGAQRGIRGGRGDFGFA